MYEYVGPYVSIKLVTLCCDVLILVTEYITLYKDEIIVRTRM